MFDLLFLAKPGDGKAFSASLNDVSPNGIGGFNKLEGPARIQQVIGIELSTRLGADLVYPERGAGLTNPPQDLDIDLDSYLEQQVIATLAFVKNIDRSQRLDEQIDKIKSLKIQNDSRFPNGKFISLVVTLKDGTDIDFSGGF